VSDVRLGGYDAGRDVGLGRLRLRRHQRQRQEGRAVCGDAGVRNRVPAPTAQNYRIIQEEAGMKIDVEIDEAELRRLVVARLRELMPNAGINTEDVKIEVMTKNNYRVKEWENGAFRARVHKAP
jgi:hypothetical protein